MTRKKSRMPKPAPSAADLTQAALERYRPIFSGEDFAALLAELDQPLVSALRVNPLKAVAGTALPAWAERYGWQVQPVPYCDHGWWISSAQTPISQTPEHHLGLYYIQDAASMLPVELFDFPEGSPLILDLAASPGGKTTHIIAKTGDHGLVIANDSSRERLTALRIVLANWGAFGTAITNFPGEKYGQWFPETFDRVLLDAPCSMENLRSTESHPMRPITARERTSLAGRQARLLASALQAVRTGGQVVYSTCTLALEEDEGVLDTALKQFPGLIQVDDITHRLPSPAPGLTSDGARVYDPAVQQSARLWPHRYHTSGFFSARLTKLAPLPTAHEAPPARALERIGWAEMDDRAANLLYGKFSADYGFDLGAVLNASRAVLWTFGNAIYAIPLGYLNRFASLPVQGLGLLIGEDTPEGFAPSHEFCARYGSGFSSGKIILPDDQVSAWLHGEDAPLPTHTFSSGQMVILTDSIGRNLGRGRIAPNKIKNLLPRRVL